MKRPGEIIIALDPRTGEIARPDWDELVVEVASGDEPRPDWIAAIDHVAETFRSLDSAFDAEVREALAEAREDAEHMAMCNFQRVM